MLKQLARILMRSALFLLVTSTVVAILIARANPPTVGVRVAANASQTVVDANLGRGSGGTPHLFDTSNGRITELTLPKGQMLNHATLSPWSVNGRRQLVGLGWNSAGSGSEATLSEVGLIRMSLPDGEVLDRVDSSGDALPAGTPCWLPGQTARLLYVAGDARIYRVDFEDQKGPISAHSEVRPIPLSWSTKTPAETDVLIKDIVYLNDTRLPNGVLASVRLRDPKTRRKGAFEIWWLGLDAKCSSITQATRLLQSSTSEEVLERRLPNVIGSSLAYLVRLPRRSGYQLRGVPLRLSAETAMPIAFEDEARPLANDCLRFLPIPTSNGLSVVVAQSTGSSQRLLTVPIDPPPTRRP